MVSRDYRMMQILKSMSLGMWRQVEFHDKVRKGTQQCVFHLCQDQVNGTYYVYNTFKKNTCVNVYIKI